MKRALLTIALVIATAAPSMGSPPVADPFFSVYGRRHVVHVNVQIEMVAGSEPITMGKTWELARLDGDGSAFYQWPDDQLELEPGESRLWEWDQRINACYGECVNVHEGDPAPAGRYEVVTTMNGEEVREQFLLGQYFTLGFRERTVEFKVFVATQDEIDQMTAEAAKPDDEKRLITSGIVRRRAGYNRDWNFSMGPKSIELGEVFIEVCDGSPGYVSRHRDEWLGQRWCPWSSFVKRVGR